MLFTIIASAQSSSGKEIVINKKPLQDFSSDVVDRWSKKEIDLTKPFLVELEGVITQEGKFDPEKTRFVNYEGDEDIVNVAKSAIEAIGDSGFLQHLTKLYIQDVNIILFQTENSFSAHLKSKIKSKERAKTLSSALRSLLIFAKLNVKGSDEKFVLKNTSSTSKDSLLIIEFNAPKADFHKMINRQLKQASKYK